MFLTINVLCKNHKILVFPAVVIISILGVSVIFSGVCGLVIDNKIPNTCRYVVKRENRQKKQKNCQKFNTKLKLKWYDKWYYFSQTHLAYQTVICIHMLVRFLGVISTKPISSKIIKNI